MVTGNQWLPDLDQKQQLENTWIVHPDKYFPTFEYTGMEPAVTNDQENNLEHILIIMQCIIQPGHKLLS